jgi:SAM-dependent methyltransferase
LFRLFPPLLVHNRERLGHRSRFARGGVTVLRLDIGCGAAKREGFLGVDFAGAPDFLCDIERNRLPFDDQNAECVFSSHCLEHIEQDRLAEVFKEITRVCAHDALIEIWHPHWSHSDAFVLGHVSHLSEAIYDHLGCTHRGFWAAILGAKWTLEEVRYGVDDFVIEDMARAGIDLDFAISYYREVVREVGVFIRVDRSESDAAPTYRRSACVVGRRNEIIQQLAIGPRRVPLGRGI